jgi:hypothetical protein
LFPWIYCEVTCVQELNPSVAVFVNKTIVLIEARKDVVESGNIKGAVNCALIKLETDAWVLFEECFQEIVCEKVAKVNLNNILVGWIPRY